MLGNKSILMSIPSLALKPPGLVLVDYDKPISVWSHGRVDGLWWVLKILKTFDIKLIHQVKMKNRP